MKRRTREPSEGPVSSAGAEQHRPDAPEKPARRAFMGGAGALAVGSTLAVTGRRRAEAQSVPAEEPTLSGFNPRARLSNQQLLIKNYRVRADRARANGLAGVPPLPNNGDEARYANRIGTDTRGLPHDQRGEVDPSAFNALLHALETRKPEDFEQIPLGGTRKLLNPLGALAVNLIGAASHQKFIPVAPALASAERAAEAVENYWQSLLRDVPFSEYHSGTSNELVLAAARELSGLSGYTGPRDASGKVTPELLFRGTARYPDPGDPTGRRFRSVVPPGVATGPHISQFLLRDIPYGPYYISALARTQLAGAQNEFLTDYDEWLAVQDGGAHTGRITFDPVRRYVATGRDLGEYAHGGAPAFWGAAQILSTAPSSNSLVVGGLGAQTSPTNPYLKLTTTAGGTGTFGTPYYQSLLPYATSRGQRAAYFHKWFVHRTLRPEAFGGLLHNKLANGVDYPLHRDILESEALDRSFRKHGVYLLPLAFPEGAPNHASYPGGASLNTSVNVVLLKAFYDGDFVISNPVQPDPNDPSKLIPYVGPSLTVGGELNKLATNVGLGRNWGGVHWRSDAAVCLPQAEEIAISILRDERATFAEAFEGFRFTRFDGTVVTI